MSYFVREEVGAILPRERLLTQGEEVLSNAELLSILLSVGTNKENVFHLAQSILERFDSLIDLKEVSIQELEKIDGIGRVKACQIRAMVELGKRIQLAKKETEGNVTSSFALAHRLMEEMKGLHQERLVVFFLNTQNVIVKKQTVFVGTLNQSIAHPRDIFREAVRYSSASIIIAHNHPSGDITPSSFDIEVTKKIEKAGEMIGIPLIDHLIIGEDKYYSFREEGKLRY